MSGFCLKGGGFWAAELGPYRRLARRVRSGWLDALDVKPVVAELMAELDPACYVIDCLPNIGAKEVEERTATLVKILRAAHPKTPRTGSSRWPARKNA